MKTNIIRIGNSQGIRIPKIILEQSHIGTEVELEVKDKKIVISPASKPRQGWEKKFQRMTEKSDDRLIDKSRIITQWDSDEWEW
ncbi:MAG TPA: AbrB/MazE/SpoVT family DNA-binding domain-containing protein [Actinobacteria bacterium]|nr:AbrB/MazE/SpoVT family DNA-binding domain-containing protein [Actinomycetes bacterium]HEX21372.1 AbrB/MazE/SpoVT family DNA-binding domain-containing protein [Actinomycetota bacterium]